VKLGKSHQCGRGSRERPYDLGARSRQVCPGGLPIIASIQRSGITSLRGLAIALNNRGVPTARNGEWHVSNVRNLLARSAA
jgi:hypothetical protein